MDRATWDARQKRKFETVRLNQEARDKRSPKEQLQILDERLGKDQGAKKERAKLLAQIEKGN